MMSLSSSSSSSWAAAPAPAREGKPQGNARFLSSMQSCKPAAQLNRQTCILVGPLPTGGHPPVSRTGARPDLVRAAATPSGGRPAQVPAVPTRRIHSSSSTATYSGDSYSSYTYTEPPDTASDAGTVAAAGESNEAAAIVAGADGGMPRAAAAETAAAHPSAIANATLSVDPYTQVQQQLHHPRLTAQQLRGGNAETAMKGSAGAPGWWSCESSLLPDGSTVPSSTASTASNLETRLPRNGALLVGAGGKERRLAELKDALPVSKNAKTSVADTEVFSSSSCGCPTSCSCRTYGDPADGFHYPCERRGQRLVDCLENRGLEHDASSKFTFKHSPHSDDTDGAFDPSDTGTTPDETGRSSDDSSDYPCSASCCSCCHRPFSSSSHSSNTAESSTLCSSCAAAAGTRVLPDPSRHDRCHRRSGSLPADRRRRRDQRVPFALQHVFLDAVRGHTMWPEVPPLLHLCKPPDTGEGRGGAARRKDDATVLAERERARLRAEYIQQAALLAAGQHGDAGLEESAYCPTEGTSLRAKAQRCSTSTQTEKNAEDDANRRKEEECRQQQQRLEACLAEERLRGLAAAQCAEVALPMIQRELETYETRSSAQQQHQLNMLLQQLQDYQTQIQNQQKMRAEELQAHRAQWELEQQRVRELAELRQQVSRKHQATSFGSEDGQATSAWSRLGDVKHAVGTQHSDGSLERLEAVKSDAAAWLANELCSLEDAARRDVEKTEEEARHQVFHVLEESSRRVLMSCQVEVLQWQRRCVDERQTASCKAELRMLQLQEMDSRQELTACSQDCLRDLWGNFQKQMHHVVLAASHHDLRQARSELGETVKQLEALREEHADAMKHMQQLRLQLIHALRMPTITLPDHAASSCMAPPGAPLMDVAYAYATATTGNENPEGQGSSGPAVHAGVEGRTNATSPRPLLSAALEAAEDLPVHRRFARAHQEALRVVRAQCRSA